MQNREFNSIVWLIAKNWVTGILVPFSGEVM
jgi:hypothetical protein